MWGTARSDGQVESEGEEEAVACLRPGERAEAPASKAAQTVTLIG